MKYDPLANISLHFKMREVAKSETADRKGIDNTPPSHVLETARLLALSVLDPVRAHFGVPFSPQSWYRCEELEKVITAGTYQKWANNQGLNPKLDTTWVRYFIKKSHPKGEAADIEIPGVSNQELYEYIKKNLPFDQLIREFAKPGDPYSGWVHVSYRANHNRKETFSIG